MDTLINPLAIGQTRRQFFSRTATGIGTAALASLLQRDLFAAADLSTRGALPALHFAPKAKHVIYLHQSGAPSHVDLFDYKPEMQKHHGEELPASIRQGQRITGMTSGQKAFPIAATKYKFSQSGKSGLWLSELLPHTAKIADEICLVRSLHTDAINHDPAITFIQTGSEQPGRPCLGSWLSYGIGSENQNLPAFVVLISQGTGELNDQPLFSRLWGSGFLPSSYQGVKFRSKGDPVLYINNPPGIDDSCRREMLDAVKGLNEMQASALGDPEIETRIAQYEMAYRMQASVPELMSLEKEPASTFDLYGTEAKTPGTFAANALLARRLVERGVRFVQLYHTDWDHHGDQNNNLSEAIEKRCREVDRASAALVLDLKQRGLLEDTLVIWGGEFGRTPMGEKRAMLGRDHHIDAFTMWMAGGGVKPGMIFGATDELGFGVVENKVHVHDLHATILHLLGFDHEKLTYRFQGRDFRLTDVHGEVVKPVLT